MKKFAKGSLIAALSMLVIGFVILFVCIIIGGNTLYTSLKDNVLQNEGLTDLLGVNFISFHNGEDLVDFSEDITTYSGDHENNKVAASSEILNLDIDFGGGNCIITESSDEFFHISSENAEEFQYYIEGKTLYIAGFMDEALFKVNLSDNNLLLLEIPKGFSFQNIDIELGAGYLEADSLSAGNTINLEIGVGELITYTLLADTLNIELGAGNVEIIEATVQNSDVTIRLGNLTLNGVIQKDLSATCGMGNLEFYLNDSMENHNYNIECNMGNLTVDEKSFGGLSQSTKIDNNAASTYTLECGVGNLTVQF